MATAGTGPLVAAYVYTESRVMAIRRPSRLIRERQRSGRAPGETMRSPERLKAIHESLREPELPDCLQGCVRLRAR
jgi:hypothetical protein